MRSQEEIQAAAQSFVRKPILFLRLFELTATLVNIYALFWFSAESFQRLGAFWVAMLIIVFGFTRLMMSGLKAVVDNPQELSLFTFSDGPSFLEKFFGPSEKAKGHLADSDDREDLKRAINLIENRLAAKGYSGELIMLAIATLQWGYGDIFHCFVNGRGLVAC